MSDEVVVAVVVADFTVDRTMLVGLPGPMAFPAVTSKADGSASRSQMSRMVHRRMEYPRDKYKRGCTIEDDVRPGSVRQIARRHVGSWTTDLGAVDDTGDRPSYIGDVAIGLVNRPSSRGMSVNVRKILLGEPR
jgi:hypothetical protein